MRSPFPYGAELKPSQLVNRKRELRDVRRAIQFTAGPSEETAGLFGYLTAVPREFTQGSDQ
jgi:hypothetical protein